MKSLKEITVEILNKGELNESLEQALIHYCEEQGNLQSYIYEIAFCYGRAIQLILSNIKIEDAVKLFLEEENEAVGDFTTYEIYKDMLVKVKEKNIPEIYNKDLDTLRKEYEECEETIKSKIKRISLDINKEYKSPIVAEWVKKAREMNQRYLRILYESHKEIDEILHYR